jgi:hypothetical protein
MLKDDPFLMQKPHYEMMEILRNSEIYKCMYRMPKPAVHHTHLTGAVDVNSLVELTYYDFVYYSEKKNDFYISKTPQAIAKNGVDVFAVGGEKESYIKANDLRSFWKGG